MQSSIRNHQSDASHLHGCQLGLQFFSSRLRFTQCTLCPHRLTAAQSLSHSCSNPAPATPTLGCTGKWWRWCPTNSCNHLFSLPVQSLQLRFQACYLLYHLQTSRSFYNRRLLRVNNSSTPLNICQRADTTSLQRPPTLWEITLPCVPAL